MGGVDPPIGLPRRARRGGPIGDDAVVTAPSPSDLASPGFVGQLADGLVRRWTTPADTPRLGELLGTVWVDHEDEVPNPRTAHEAQLLMEPGFPFGTPYDAAVVEDTAQPARPLVACTFLWRHRWSFAGTPIGVTRPEIVATHPGYRRRGLVRALFEMVHARGDLEGNPLSAITGIPYFYRQFGYEYVLDLGAGFTVPLDRVPAVGRGRAACTLRPASLDDVPAMAAIYAAGRAGSLVWHEADEGRWRWMIEIWERPTVRAADPTRVGVDGRYWTIRDAEGALCGYVLLPIRRWDAELCLRELWFAPGADVPALAPALLRRAVRLAAATPPARPGVPACAGVRFEGGDAPRLQDALGDGVSARANPHYAWYFRVPDVAAFLRLVAPALAERLAGSGFGGLDREVTIDLYRYGILLRLRNGELDAVEPWQRPDDDDDAEPSLGCPPLTFLQLLLGYRSLDELAATFPDVSANDRDRPLLDALFPKLPSIVEPLG